MPDEKLHYDFLIKGRIVDGSLEISVEETSDENDAILNNVDKTLSIKGAALLLDCHVETIRNYLKLEFPIPHTRSGVRNKYTFKKKAILAWHKKYKQNK